MTSKGAAKTTGSGILWLLVIIGILAAGFFVFNWSLGALAGVIEAAGTQLADIILMPFRGISYIVSTVFELINDLIDLIPDIPLP